MEKLCSIKGSKLYFNGEELLKIQWLHLCQEV